MKLLHTSDWHVGKRIRGRSRADEHRAVLAEIATIARAEAVDAVLVAGDLFETAAPAPEAEGIVYRALLDLAGSGATVVVIAGNHDNPRRLAAVAPLLELGTVRLVTEPTRPADGGVVEGAVGDEQLRVATLPFVSQRGIVRADDLMAKDASELSPKYAERVRRIVEALTADFGTRDDAVEVVCAHLFVDGGAMGGGERSAHTVFDYAVPGSVFPTSTHYVALGHLHRAQPVAAGCPARYAGSPLQLDFGEERDTKSIVIVEATPDAPADVRTVGLTEGRALRTLSGTIDDLAAAVGTTGDDHLRIVVTEPRRAGLAEQVRGLFPDCVDVVVRPPDDDDRRAERAERPDLRDATPRQLFEAYLAETDIDDDRLLGAFDALLEEVGG